MPRKVENVGLQSKSVVEQDILVISDSEEERIRQRTHHKQCHSGAQDIIEISSDEDDLSPPGLYLDGTPSKKKLLVKSDPPCIKTTFHRDFSDAATNTHLPTKPSHLEDVMHDSDIVEISDDSPNEQAYGSVKILYEQWEKDGEQESQSDDDGAILTLDEPRSSRKPIRLRGLNGLTKSPVPIIRNTSKTKVIDQDKGASSDECPRTGSGSLLLSLQKTPRDRKPGKKAADEANLQGRRAYAQSIFNELNKVVFRNRLPENTELVWNRRLLTTAGRAKWHKSSQGVHSTQVELAEKILDCEERIRNTLSHEMCHLACWIIDEKPDEKHGSLFISWTKKIMRARPDITISTRHNYEINYKYQWKCAECEKIYGRYSKSINPDACVCGVCKVGKLVPMFQTRTRTPKVKASSSMAVIQPPASPYSIRSILRPGEMDSVLDSDPFDSDIELLNSGLGSMTVCTS